MLEGGGRLRDVGGTSQDLRRLPANSFRTKLLIGGAEHAPALVDQGRQATGKHGLAHERERHAEVGGVHAGPLAGAFLAGSVQDVVDQVIVAICTFAFEAGGKKIKNRRSVRREINGGAGVRKNIGGDVDEERVEVAGLPPAKRIR